MSDYIPFDIQKEIIKKVFDVKSLTLFKSVSKEWESFINSPDFITSFGIRDTQPRRLLLRYTQSRNVKYVSFADDDVQQQLDFAPNVPEFNKEFRFYQVIGSSCGLWCLYGKTNMVVIWNPSIKKFVRIVVPRELARTSINHTFFGFGVRPLTYNPTVVGISISYREGKLKAGVYTLSSNTWEIIPSCGMPRESIQLRWTATRAAIGNYIFWVACDMFYLDDGLESEIENLILSFDLIDHKFGEVNLPASLANRVNVRVDISMSQLNGSLAVSAYIYEANVLVYGVWVMGEEGGSMTSFTKLFNIKTPKGLRVSKILGFTSSDEPLVETKKGYGQSAAIEVYKPCSEHVDDLGINGDCGSFFICPYAESLLLIDHSDGCIIYKDRRKMMAIV